MNKEKPQLTIKQIEKELAEKFPNEGINNRHLDFFFSKLTQLIDEMVGEKQELWGLSQPDASEVIGYNQKVQELKDYKQKFLTL